MNSGPADSEKTESPICDVLLDAAEELLAAHGVAGTSVRSIIQAAHANLGAVNYHFGSKDHLIAQVILRRLIPIDQARIDRLDALENAARGAPLDLRDIVDALVRPVVESDYAGGKQTTVFRMLARAFQEADPKVRSIVHNAISHVCARFDAALLRTMPGLKWNDLFWSMMMAMGTMHQGLDAWAHADQLGAMPNGLTPVPLEREIFIQRVVAFVTGGLQASCALAQK